MRYITGLLGFLLALSATGFAQQFFPAKDLAFAQIAAGGGYETVLNVTNRGTTVYNGVLTVIPSDTTKPFPVLINGNVPPSGRGFDVIVDPGATAAFRITSGSAGTLSGFATIGALDRSQAGMIEGNLTYYIKSSDGKIVDSVGVAPSSEVFRAAIPFDDFFTVALALANSSGPQSPQATVKLSLFDAKNAPVSSVATQVLANNQQVAKFLYQYFPSVATGFSGRVEIQSDHQVLGTALTFVNGGQASSLPFLPAMQEFTYTISALGNTLSGDFYFSINGPHVIGYDHSLITNGQPTNSGLDQVSGVLWNGNLELYVHGGRNDPSSEILVYGVITGYDPSQSTQSCPLVFYLVNPPGVAGQGTVTFTAVN